MQGLLAEIEELVIANKMLMKEKDEQRAELEEGNRMNLAMKRNIEEVIQNDLNLYRFFIVAGGFVGISAEYLEHESAEN